MPRTIYLALGDDIAAGAGVIHPALGFVRYVNDFLRSRSVVKRTAVVAKPDWTTKDLRQAVLSLDPAFWKDVRVTTICIGMTDFSRMSIPQQVTIDGSPFPPLSVLKRSDEFRDQITQLFQAIDDKEIPHAAVTTLYNPFPAFKPSGRFIDAMNSILQDCASMHKFSVIHVDRKFTGNQARLIQGYGKGGWFDLMSPPPRPIFPNEEGHKLIGQLITQQLKPLFPVRRNQPRPLRRSTTAFKRARRLPRHKTNPTARRDPRTLA